MDLPPTVDALPTRTGSRRLRTAAVALLGIESLLLGLSLPVQAFMFLSLGWEGGDEALKQRMIDAVPLLVLGSLVAAMVTAVASFSVAREGRAAMPVAGLAAGLVLALAVGWALTWRGDLWDATVGGFWLLYAVPAPAAYLIVLGLGPRHS